MRTLLGMKTPIRYQLYVLLFAMFILTINADWNYTPEEKEINDKKEIEKRMIEFCLKTERQENKKYCYDLKIEEGPADE